MEKYQKFSTAFVLALGLHLTLLALFAVGVSDETEVVKQKAVPEIIQASILDDNKIQEEANRLKEKEISKQQFNQRKQQELEAQRKKEQQLLQNAQKKRVQEEQKAKELEIKNKQRARKEKQKLEQIKKQKVLEAARLAKIKQQKQAEKKRLDAQRKAENKKRELARQAEQKRKQTLLAKQKAEEAEQQAVLKQQAKAAQNKLEQDRQSTASATAAIQQKVNNRWIRPMSSNQGLKCTIRVKLLPSGDVMDATVIRSSGDSIFDRSAENAVRKASPLPVPKDRKLFTQKFRVFAFEFKPE